LIFHRVESSVMLCYVDQHGPAYDWAARRKLSWLLASWLPVTQS
jgi:hypothetical protein